MINSLRLFNLQMTREGTSVRGSAVSRASGQLWPRQVGWTVAKGVSLPENVPWSDFGFLDSLTSKWATWVASIGSDCLAGGVTLILLKTISKGLISFQTNCVRATVRCRSPVKSESPEPGVDSELETPVLPLSEQPQPWNLPDLLTFKLYLNLEGRLLIY